MPRPSRMISPYHSTPRHRPRRRHAIRLFAKSVLWAGKRLRSAGARRRTVTGRWSHFGSFEPSRLFISCDISRFSHQHSSKSASAVWPTGAGEVMVIFYATPWLHALLALVFAHVIAQKPQVALGNRRQRPIGAFHVSKLHVLAAFKRDGHNLAAVQILG